MPERAQVRSVEAIERFRASLIVFITRARAALEEANDQVRQMRVWLEHDRRTHWEREARRRKRLLDDAEQELFSARLSQLQTQTAAQVLAVERAKRGVRQADEKRDLVKRWLREFESRAEPLNKQVDQLQMFVTSDLVKAAAHLAGLLKSLEAYTSVATGLAAPPDIPSPAQTAERGADLAEGGLP